jgi:hypothetical protein
MKKGDGAKIAMSMDSPEVAVIRTDHEHRACETVKDKFPWSQPLPSKLSWVAGARQRQIRFVRSPSIKRVGWP